MNSVYSNSFLIRYDVVRQRICLTREADPEATSLKLELADLQEMGFAGAAKWLGELLLLLIPEARATFLPETKDKTKPITFINRLIDALQSKSVASPEIQYDLAMLFLVRFRISKKAKDLLRADNLLRDAAKLGDARAVHIMKEQQWNQVFRMEKRKIESKKL